MLKNKISLLTLAALGSTALTSAIIPAAAQNAPEPAVLEQTVLSSEVDIKTPEEIQAMYENGEAITVGEAVTWGLSMNPEHGVSKAVLRATDEELRQAQALYLPSVNLDGDTGFEYTEDETTRGGANGDDEELYRYDVGITLTQLLFDGFGSQAENARQMARVISSKEKVRESSELIGLDIVESYLDVVRQRKLLEIARSNVADHQNILTQIEDSSRAGRTTQADVEQARARLASARAQEANVIRALRTAEAGYIEQVGVKPIDLYQPNKPAGTILESIDAEIQSAMQKSPTLAFYRADIDAADAEIDSAESSFYPQVDLELNARTGKDLGGVRGDDTSASALAVADWNVYRGGSDTARVREFESRKLRETEEYKNAIRDLESDIRSTWARMTTAQERTKQFTIQAEANRRLVNSYKDQFQLNRRTLLDVLDTQNELVGSRNNTVNESFVELFAMYRLLALRGDLLETLNVTYFNVNEPAKM